MSFPGTHKVVIWDQRKLEFRKPAMCHTGAESKAVGAVALAPQHPRVTVLLGECFSTEEKDYAQNGVEGSLCRPTVHTTRTLCHLAIIPTHAFLFHPEQIPSIPQKQVM